MGRKVLVGAPSLTGKGIHDAVADAFAGDEFPLTKRITNLTITSISFAEVRLFLTPSFGEQPAADVTFKDADQLSRVLTDAGQIAELSQWSHMLTIEDIEEVVALVAAEPVSIIEAEVKATAPEIEMPEAGPAHGEQEQSQLAPPIELPVTEDVIKHPEGEQSASIEAAKVTQSAENELAPVVAIAATAAPKKSTKAKKVATK